MSKKKKVATRPAIPDGFIGRMERLLGTGEAAQLTVAIDGEPSVSIRLNRRKASGDAVTDRCGQLRRVPWCSSGYYLDERPDFIHDPLLHAGVYYVQEAASMVYESIVESLADQIDREGQPLRVLDLCAAPGGKSTAMLNGLAEAGPYVLVANEYDRKRSAILKENLDKWGDPDVIITNSDTSRFARLSGLFDIVAVDAPCSGEGMMRREPVARTQWNEGLIEQCALLQREILGNAVAALAPGGYLIYSTCTFNEKENEENAGWLEEHYGLGPVGSPRHFYPHRAECEGLFVAIFRKPADPSGAVARSLDREGMAKAIEKAGIRILSAGTEKTQKKNDMEVPSSRQVLAYDYDRDSFPTVELTREEAVAYLRRNALSLPTETPTGYVCVCFQGHPLGLVKNLGSRANNLYPSEWRVLT